MINGDFTAALYDSTINLDIDQKPVFNISDSTVTMKIALTENDILKEITDAYIKQGEEPYEYSISGYEYYIVIISTKDKIKEIYFCFSNTESYHHLTYIRLEELSHQNIISALDKQCRALFNYSCQDLILLALLKYGK